MATHHELADLTWAQKRYSERATVDLQEGDTAPDPSSTRRLIRGPARVEFYRFPDGGLEARVGDLPASDC